MASTGTNSMGEARAPRRTGQSIRLTVGIAALAVAAFAALLTAPAADATLGTQTTYVPVRECTKHREGFAACFAVRLAAKTTTGPTSTAPVRRAPAGGIAGGYTPYEVAKAYGVDVNAAAGATQTVGIVDAYDDPSVKTDLATFDSHYGIPAETATSFKVVNQAGAASPLPAANTGWAAEITLDVQTVRALCRKCTILLVEATSNSFADLAAATNEAAALGATEISNSYGGGETNVGITPTVAAAYSHPGVVITASTGDDGWYSSDLVHGGAQSGGMASVPAAYKHVVGVSGTSLYLNADSTRASEDVWNDNGASGRNGDTAGHALGAAGGGCSTLAAGGEPWQLAVTGYTSLGCATGTRSSTDIAAIADPYTGFDIYRTYGRSSPGWDTFGGTSLASPAVAAMWALAGGSGGVAYPSLTLYGHYKHDTTRPTYDVVVGGTGVCDIASATTCSNYYGQNPNTYGHGLLDCAWGPTGAATATLTNRNQCYAVPGFDGVSGVGTPKGLGTFAPMNPTPVIASPGTVTHGVAKTFASTGTSDPFPGGTISSYAWNFGDGHTGTGSSSSHTYTTAGTRTVSLKVTDNYGRTATKTLSVVVH